MERAEILPVEEADLDAVVGLFAEHDFALKKREWLEWKYRMGPYGPATCFKVVLDGRICGAASIAPRPFRWRDRTVWGLQSVDGLVSREARGRGVFNLVNRFFSGNPVPGIDGEAFRFAFASVDPSKKALVHAGWVPLASFELYTCVLRPSAFAGARGFRAAGGIRPVDPLWSRFVSSPRSSRIEVIEPGPFENGVEAAFPPERVHGDRSAEFMRWRVASNPMVDHVTLGVLDGGRPVGHVVGKLHGRTFEILEIRVPGERAYLAAILRRLLERGDVDSVDVFALGPNARIGGALLRGFVRRTHPGAMFVHGLERTSLPRDPAAWDLSYLDSDW